MKRSTLLALIAGLCVVHGPIWAQESEETGLAASGSSLEDDLDALGGLWYRVPARSNAPVSAVVLQVTRGKYRVSKLSVGTGSEYAGRLKLAEVNGRRVMLRAGVGMLDGAGEKMIAEYQLAGDALTLKGNPSLPGLEDPGSLWGAYSRAPTLDRAATDGGVKQLDGVWIKAPTAKAPEQRPMVLLMRGERLTIREIGGGARYGHGSFRAKERGGKQVLVSVPFLPSDKERVIAEYSLEGDVLTLSGAPTPVGLSSGRYDVAGEWVRAKPRRESAAVGPAATPPEPDPKDPQTTTARIVNAIHFKYSGSSRTPDDGLRALVPIKPGQAFSPRALSDSIATLYRSGRFADVRADVSEVGKGQVDVSFTLAPRE